MSNGKSTAVVKFDVKDVEHLDQVADDCRLSVKESSGCFARTFAMANGMRDLKAAIKPEMMSAIMELQGSSLGFRTDKDATQQQYPIEAVKECLIEATLRGARPVGNEFNIIAGRCYLTKEYFQRAVGEFEGLTDLRLHPGVPTTAPNGALVPYSATWKLNGKEQSLERRQRKVGDDVLDERIPVKVNAGMGADAILGKATRKMLAAIYGMLTGSAVAPDGEVEESAVIDVTPAKPQPSLDLNEE